MSNLVSAETVLQRLGDPALRLVDARFDLKDPGAGRRAYEAGHLPGAVHLDLDQDLSGPPGPAGGRHPLPDPRRLADRLGALGIGNGHDVVVYDADGGMFATRAWWLMRYLGHRRVQVLDGGLAAFEAAGGELEPAIPAPTPTSFEPDVQTDMAVDRSYVAERLQDDRTVLLDARAPERYRGEVEPLDARAGHIPSARNRPYAGNLEGGRFLAPERLRQRYALAEEAEEVVVYCGSGVSATHAALAVEEAGLPLPRLYAGSWSQWSSDPHAPVATGDDEAGPG